VHHALHVLRADCYVIASDVPGSEQPATAHKLFQFTFSRDGSIYVTFPYLSGCGAVMGEVTMPPGEWYFETFNVGETFSVSSHAVKYAHHPSGRAHFSLSGKVLTTGTRQSVPLSATSGHLCTVRLQGLRAFTPVEANERPSHKRRVIRFDAAESDSVSFVAHVYGERDLLSLIRLRADAKRYWIAVELADGTRLQGIVLATPYLYEGERRYILLGCNTDDGPALKNVGSAAIAFMGGFDPPKRINEISAPTSLLMMFIHPMNVAVVSQTLPNIDLAATLRQGPRLV
jgi:hypothetical protein